MLLKFEPAIFKLLLLVFLFLSPLHLFTGYADNGDYYRTVKCMLEKPVGFSEMWPLTGSDEGNRRFFKEWHDQWQFDISWPFMTSLKCYHPIKPYFFIQACLSGILSGQSNIYSVILGSLLTRLLYAIFVIFLLLRIREIVPRPLGWLLAFLVVSIALESTWIGFFNSFYEEQLAILLLPLFAIIALSSRTIGPRRAVVSMIVIAAIIGASKVTLFYLPTLTGIFTYPLTRRQLSKTVFVLSVLTAQLVSYLPVHLTYYKQKANITAFHSVYSGGLIFLSKDEAAGITLSGGKSIYPDCVGAIGTSLLGKTCLDLTKSRYVDLLYLFAARPDIPLKMLRYLFVEGSKLRIQYLLPIKGGPDFRNLKVFNIYATAFSFGYSYCTILLFILSILILYFGRPTSPLSVKMLFIGIYYLTVGFSQYLVSLADGYMDITRHLSLGNYSLAISAPFVIGGAILSYNQRRNQSLAGGDQILGHSD